MPKIYKEFPIREKFKYFPSEYTKGMPKNKVWIMTILFAIMLALFLSPHAIYPSMGALPLAGEPGQFQVYDYKQHHGYYVNQPIDDEIRATLENDPVSAQPACINCEAGSDRDANIARFHNGLEKALGTWTMVKPLAEQIRAISGSDDELFANMVLQVVHQIKYKQTYDIQFPIITIATNSGDCDNVATLAAAIMKAGGLDSVVIIGPVDLGNADFELQNHAMVGVHLSERPDDIFTFANTRDSLYPYHIDPPHTDKIYYVAEATWPKNWPTPTSLDYNTYASFGDVNSRAFVGENPLQMGDPDFIAQTPDTPYMDASKTTVNNIRVNYIQ